MQDHHPLTKALEGWALRGGRTERIRFTTDPEDSWSIGAVLYALWDDSRRVSTELADHLGLPLDTTMGHLAQLLWTMCEEERFPCCTHGEAVRHLRRTRNGGADRVDNMLTLA